ncbi:MAG: glucoamylase family protein, partial [Candidatus Omnitrophota bacterium]|nr:glucoamylase family protein [Candidatus Omnitrophota bacterium]
MVTRKLMSGILIPAFLLCATCAFAANITPKVGTVAPSSGSSSPDQAVSFTTTYTDADGWQNLYDARFLINTAISGTNCFYGRYDQNANKLYLCKDNDTNEATRWLGGFTPGSSNIIENSYAKLDCSTTTISGSGATLSVTWSVTFKPTFTGAKKTYLYVKDDSNVIANWIQKGTWSITDNTSPVGTIIINSGNQYTSSIAATLTLSATDSGGTVSQMRFSNNNSTWSVAETYAATKNWTLTTGAGTKTVYVKFRDAAGNWSGVYSDTIILDTGLPTGSIKVNNNASYTNSISVTLNLSGQDNVGGSGLSQMKFSNNNSTWSIPEAYAATKSWTLTSGNGTKYVYVKFKDAAGNWSSAYSDSIILDTVAPTGSIRINNGAATATSLSVTLNLSATDSRSGVSQMQFSNDNITWSTSEAYSTTKSWTLTSGNGTKTVRVKFKDAAGNWSIAYSDTITLSIADTTPPTGSILINGGAADTNNQTVTLTLSATDTGSGMGTGAQMQFSNNNSTWSTPEAYAATKSWTLLIGDGTKTVYVKYKDAAGNWSGSCSDTIVLDTVPPPTILTASLPDGIAGEDYNENLNAIDGTPPYTWSIVEQNLPDGLTLNSATGEISGIPTVANTFGFVAKVTDARLKTATKTLSINILPVFPPITDEELLDQTEAKAALYFYNEVLTNGFVKYSDTSNFSSVSATGFGLAALCVMAERYQTSPHWTVSPAEVRARVIQVLDNCITYQSNQAPDGNDYGVAGFLFEYIHFNGNRGGGSRVQTSDMALFLAGAITAGEYFGGEVKTKATQIYNNINWNYFLVIAKHQFSREWFPGSTVNPYYTWDAPSDETMLISLLAIGANPDNQDMLKTMYSWPRVPVEYGGYAVVGSPYASLYTYLQGHCFFDFKKFGKDNPSLVSSSKRPINWWVNSVNAAYANRQFCIDNASAYSSYGENSWGITACKYLVPPPYWYPYDWFPFGAAPTQYGGAGIHDGTIAPYGAISCMPLMRTSSSEALDANLAFRALRNYYQKYYHHLWGTYGPRDSFNHNEMFSGVYRGIDVGQQVLMIENYRSGLIWNNFMKNEKVMAATNKVFSPAEPQDPSFIFVDMVNSNDPSEDGSYEHSFDKIQEGIDAASDGNTIIVREGIYRESLVINKSGIILQGDNQGSQIEWSDYSTPIIACSNIDGAETRIAGLTIGGWNVVRIDCDSTVKTLKIDNNLMARISIILQQDASATILDNNMMSGVISGYGNNSVHIEGNGIGGNGYGDTHNGIYLNGGTALIKNNAVGNSWSWGAISIANNTHADIIGNTLSNNGSWGGTAGIRIDNSTANIYNNIFSNNQAFNGGCGGALSAYNSNVSIINNSFNFTKAYRGSALYITDSNLIAKNNIFYYNDA